MRFSLGFVVPRGPRETSKIQHPASVRYRKTKDGPQTRGLACFLFRLFRATPVKRVRVDKNEYPPLEISFD